MQKDCIEFARIFNALFLYGKKVSPRNQLVIEIENFNFRFSPYTKFANFNCRNLNIDYIKKEFLWYLKGDKFDTSIAEYASLWKNLINVDGSINSNYGQYMFGDINQFDNAANIIKLDKDTRRASIVILNDKHLLSNDKDIPCTYSLNFRIRDNKLNMTVRMRSQDAIYGMCNDVPTFSFIHEMMLETLKQSFPNLKCGNYYHSVDSFHVYEKHFDMLNKLGQILYSKNIDENYVNITCPKMKGYNEVLFLRNGNFSNIPSEYNFTNWLINFNKKENNGKSK